MAEQDILNAFDECIDRMNIGQSIDDCLRDYPREAAALRPMLEAGKQVQRLHIAALEVAQAQEHSRYRFEAALRTAPPRRKAALPLYRFANLAAAVFIIFVVISGATLAAQSSLPGDPLYGLKRLSEQVRRSLSNDPALTAQFNQRRIDETQQLLSANRTADITFEGTITAMTGATWTIAALPVQVTATTQGAAQVRLGDMVEVEGYTTLEGQLFASRIRPVVTITQPLPTPVTTLAPTIAPATAPPTSTPAPTIAPTQTPIPTSTAVPTATALPPIPAATECALNAPANWERYIVQNGDTLSDLAASRGITLDLLMSVNCLSDASLIIVGQALYLPAASGAQAQPPPSNSGNDSQGMNNPNATDDHGGSNNSGSDNSGPGSSNSGSSGSGDDHGGDSNSGHGGDG